MPAQCGPPSLAYRVRTKHPVSCTRVGSEKLRLQSLLKIIYRLVIKINDLKNADTIIPEISSDNI